MSDYVGYTILAWLSHLVLFVNGVNGCEFDLISGMKIELKLNGCKFNLISGTKREMESNE